MALEAINQMYFLFSVPTENHDEIQCQQHGTVCYNATLLQKSTSRNSLLFSVASVAMLNLLIMELANAVSAPRPNKLYLVPVR